MTGPHQQEHRAAPEDGLCEFCVRRDAREYLEYLYPDDIWPREVWCCRPCLEVKLLHLERFGGFVTDIEGSRSLGSVFSR